MEKAVPRKVLIISHQYRAARLLAVAGVDEQCSPGPVYYSEKGCRNGPCSHPMGEGSLLVDETNS